MSVVLESSLTYSKDLIVYNYARLFTDDEFQQLFDEFEELNKLYHYDCHCEQICLSHIPQTELVSACSPLIQRLFSCFSEECQFDNTILALVKNAYFHRHWAVFRESGGCFEIFINKNTTSRILQDKDTEEFRNNEDKMFLLEKYPELKNCFCNELYCYKPHLIVN